MVARQACSPKMWCFRTSSHETDQALCVLISGEGHTLQFVFMFFSLPSLQYCLGHVAYIYAYYVPAVVVGLYLGCTLLYLFHIEWIVMNKKAA